MLYAFCIHIHYVPEMRINGTVSINCCPKIENWGARACQTQQCFGTYLFSIVIKTAMPKGLLAD